MVRVTESSASATRMNRRTSCMMVMARITIMTLPYDLPIGHGRAQDAEELGDAGRKNSAGP